MKEEEMLALLKSYEENIKEKVDSKVLKE